MIRLNRGQLSLEYLILFSLGLSLLLVFLPFLSRARDLSRTSIKRSELDALIRDLSTSCEEILVTGGSIEIDIDQEMEIEELQDEVKVEIDNLSSSGEWHESCILSRDEEKVTISREFENQP